MPKKDKSIRRRNIEVEEKSTFGQCFWVAKCQSPNSLTRTYKSELSKLSVKVSNWPCCSGSLDEKTTLASLKNMRKIASNKDGLSCFTLFVPELDHILEQVVSIEAKYLLV
jgi:hypothetical protein